MKLRHCKSRFIYAIGLKTTGATWLKRLKERMRLHKGVEARGRVTLTAPVEFLTLVRVALIEYRLKQFSISAVKCPKDKRP